ncbi:ABC transporter permease [Pontiella sulfatireligans]|uniref:Putative phospholipid ABC transporter permease protein MlaE n=1 Tax=Pontiella sulfatireligans TaxID=2750658 RepID=A0A6C2UCZ8_9BACT|nr:MlaE family lipid ABC transporter permease subunit [Pontiella sulfatireligans]VGO17995.1 putative phospholipid ABC transporter permease protein MlaE [Pontiella sulfatireligans]
MKRGDSEQPADVSIAQTAGQVDVVLCGRLDLASAPGVWKKTNAVFKSAAPRSIKIDAEGLSYCDGAGISILLNLKRVAARLNIHFELAGLARDYEKLLALYPLEKLADAEPALPKSSRVFVEEVGKATSNFFGMLRDQIAFIGELSFVLFKTLLHPKTLRIKDLLITADASGVRALPIIGIMGVLVGLIMAFQGAVLMAQFGAEIYIADFVGKSVTRELGPLITAILVAGRTGSAFAAELGTMKVNEEIDAFTTMGLDPVRFLVVPRVIAATLMTPLLTIYANLAGIAGGAIVMTGIGYPLVTYVNRLTSVVTSMDVIGGLAKSLAFGLIVAASGCLCGLRTGQGASAVGNSATRAVVSSILLIILADGLFAVLFYFLGI